MMVGMQSCKVLCQPRGVARAVLAESALQVVRRPCRAVTRPRHVACLRPHHTRGGGRPRRSRVRGRATLAAAVAGGVGCARACIGVVAVAVTLCAAGAVPVICLVARLAGTRCVADAARGATPPAADALAPARRILRCVEEQRAVDAEAPQRFTAHRRGAPASAATPQYRRQESAAGSACWTCARSGRPSAALSGRSVLAGAAHGGAAAHLRP